MRSRCSHIVVSFGPMYDTACTDEFHFQLTRSLKYKVLRHTRDRNTDVSEKEILLLMNNPFSLKAEQNSHSQVYEPRKKELWKRTVDKKQRAL